MDTYIINDIVKSHKAYFQSGATLSLTERKQNLKNLLKEIKKSGNSIVTALREDLGKSEVESYITEINMVVSELKLMIKKLSAWSKPQAVRSTVMLLPAESSIRKEPLGTVLIIAPWNYPFQLTMLPLVAALAAGNTAVIKPSELAPHTAQCVHNILEKIFKKEYVTVIQGDIPVTTALLEERFDFIFYTGSTHVGRIVMQAAAKNLTPVCLELGGKSPVIVMEDANIDLAAKRIAWGKILNAGQTCVAPDYILAHSSIIDELAQKLHFYFKEFIGENPLTNPNYPKIINEKSFNRLIELAATPALSYDRTSQKIAPTLITHLAINSPIMQEEIFGPLLPILPIENLGQAMNFIKEREKPLALYLFTENKEYQEKIASTISSGGLCINDTVLHVSSPFLPFGGVGNSGMNSYHGKFGFDLFSHQKAIVTKSTKFDPSLRYPPYSKFVSKVIHWLVN